MSYWSAFFHLILLLYSRDFFSNISILQIWQCGGGILFVPCSHVGHVYRSHMPYGFGKLSGKPVIASVRIANDVSDDLLLMALPLFSN